MDEVDQLKAWKAVERELCRPYKNRVTIDLRKPRKPVETPDEKIAKEQLARDAARIREEVLYAPGSLADVGKEFSMTGTVVRRIWVQGGRPEANGGRYFARSFPKPE